MTWGSWVPSVLVVLATSVVAAQCAWDARVTNPETVLLWPDGAPGALGNADEDRPALTIYLPTGAHATGAAVVVCPGGSYTRLAMDHEGYQVARLLTSRGIAAFVLKYRLGPKYHHPAMLHDVLQAIRFVRLHASKYEVHRNRIGVLGFSAGGHLASTAATLFDRGKPNGANPVDRVSSRPDFAVLAYPVIVLGNAITHTRSQRNLLGENPSSELIREMSTDTRVSADTPPTFLFHTDADDEVVPENSVRFYLALRRAGVPAELHIYEHGAHGVGLARQDAALRTWTDRLFDWMDGRGLLRAR